MVMKFWILVEVLNMIKSTNEQDFLVFNPDTIWNLNYLNLN